MWKFKERIRTLLAFGLAGGIVFVDSVSYVMSMVEDLVLVSILLAVVLPSRRKEDC